MVTQPLAVIRKVYPEVGCKVFVDDMKFVLKGMIGELCRVCPSWCTVSLLSSKRWAWLSPLTRQARRASQRLWPRPRGWRPSCGAP
eukprot:7357358-Lingulodinium_polyedra.AAC.1